MRRSVGWFHDPNGRVKPLVGKHAQQAAQQDTAHLAVLPGVSDPDGHLGGGVAQCGGGGQPDELPVAFRMADVSGDERELPPP